MSMFDYKDGILVPLTTILSGKSSTWFNFGHPIG